MSDGDLRLVDLSASISSSNSAGRVEIFHNGVWGSICSEFFEFFEGTYL